MEYPTDSPFTSALFALACKKFVDLLDQRVSIGSVNGACVLNRLSSGCRASQAVHSDRKEELRGLGIKIKNISDNGLLRNLHSIFLLSCQRASFESAVGFHSIIPQMPPSVNHSLIFFKKTLDIIQIECIIIA